MISKIRLPSLLLWVAISGCDSLTAPSAPTLDVKFSEVEWFDTGAGRMASATMTVENVGDVRQYVDRCGDLIQIVIDRLTGLTWENEQLGICPADRQMSPVPIEPGEWMERSILFRREGIHRVRLFLSSAESCGHDSESTCLRAAGEEIGTIDVPPDS